MIKYRKLFKNISIACFVAAVILFLLMLAVIEIEPINLWYERLRDYLVQIEYKIASIDELGWFVVVVLLLFTLKGAIPIILPVSACCFISGIILPVFSAFLMNLAGVCLMMVVGYWRGRLTGAGAVYKQSIRRSPKLSEFIEKNALDNPIILFIVRMLPTPLNTISRLYGSLKFNFWEYTLISLGGFAPRIIIYSLLGSNIFDPFSPQFIIPVSVLLILSGIALLIFDFIIVRNSQKEKMKELKDDENAEH